MNACVENAAPEIEADPTQLTPREAGPRPPAKEPPVSGGKITAPAENRSAFFRRWLGAKPAAQALPDRVHVRVEGLFAGVEQVLHPKLAGRPVLVGRGVVVGANREAQDSGVRTGTTLPEALRICPDAIVVPGQYAEYAEFAERVRSILETYASKVEAVGLESFYLRVVGTQKTHRELSATLRRMQAEILGRTGLRVSIGAATTETIAGTAAALAGPLGLQIVMPGTEAAFLQTTPVGRLHGIGPAHADALAAEGIHTVGQLRLVPKAVLVAAFGGEAGRQIWERARGRDGRFAKTPALSGSVSRGLRIGGGISNGELLAGWLEYLSGRLVATLCESGGQACSLGVSLRYADGFRTRRTVRLPDSTCDRDDLVLRANQLFGQLFLRGAAIEELSIGVAKATDRGGFPEPVEAGSGWNLRRKAKLLLGCLDWAGAFRGLRIRPRAFYGGSDGLVAPTACISR